MKRALEADWFHTQSLYMLVAAGALVCLASNVASMSTHASSDVVSNAGAEGPVLGYFV